jgi:biopolymer transport protein ExbD
MRIQRQEMKKARIEIIPMIDTIFFLLVFFMVTSLSMVQWSTHKVNLPISATAQLKPEEKVIVTVSREGVIYVDQKTVHDAELLGELSARVKQNPALTVVLNCDKQQHMAQFMHVFDLVKQANAADVMVATAPRDEAK